MEIALTTEDEIVAAERRGYERALRQIVERESNIGADWEGLSGEVDIMLRQAAGEPFLDNREQEQLESEVEMELNKLRRPFATRVMHYLADLLEGEEIGHAVGHIEQECRTYALLVDQQLDKLRHTRVIKSWEPFKKPAPALPKPIDDDIRTLMAHVDHDGFDAVTRINQLLIKLNSFGELKY
jgi:hypothetical protein